MGLALLGCDRELPTIKRYPRGGAGGEDRKAPRLVLSGRQLVSRIRLAAVETARWHTHGVSSCSCVCGPCVDPWTESLGWPLWTAIGCAAHWCRAPATVRASSCRVRVLRPRPRAAGQAELAGIRSVSPAGIRLALQSLHHVGVVKFEGGAR